MAFDRRDFIQKLGGIAGAFACSSFLNPSLGNALQNATESVLNLTAEECASNELFWHQIRQAFTVSPNIVNLNNGGVSPSPKVVQDAVERFNKLSNEMPSHHMWRTLDAGKEGLRENLARIAGCSPQEIAINRNASEALETVIFGLPLQAGDEVILSKQDYPNMINAWKQREVRDGIVLKWLDFDFPIEDKDLIVQKFVNAFSAQTKLIHLTHIINWNGQIMPAKAIIAAAHKQGIEVLLDAAHSFAHIDYKISDLNCDYLGTSLHKWLCAPFGSGMLFVKKEKINKLYPLFAAPEPTSDNIRKFENLGTRSVAIEQAIGQAILFHEMIGAERKEKRLQYLKKYWMEKVREFPKVQLHTSLKPAFSCAIGMFSIEGEDSIKLAHRMMVKNQIHTVAINWENIHGIRVTPNVYTVTSELDRLVNVVRKTVI